MKPIRYRNTADNVPVDFWPSLEGFLEYVEPVNARKLVPGGEQWRFDRRDPRDSWHGGLSYDEAWNQCRSGMTVTTPDFQLREELLKRIRCAPVEQPSWDVTGSSVDMGNYIAGIPECMLDYETVSGRSPKTISLLLQVNARCDVTPEQMRMRGVAYMALVDALEATRRYRVAIYAVNALEGHHSCICLKTHGHTYDPHALGFVLGHPAFLRRLHFCAQDLLAKANPQLSRDLTYAYGMPATTHSLPPEIDSNVVDIGQRLVPSRLRTTQDAINWVSSQLETFNALDKEGIA